jgi:hypothetical protein
MARTQRRTHRRRTHRKVGAVRHRTHRRRKVSGIGDTIMGTLAVVGGAAVGAFVNQAIKTALPSFPAWTGPVMLIAGGAALPHLVKNNPIADQAACGLQAAGGLFLLNETIISVPGISGVNTSRRLVYRGSPKAKSSVGAPGFADTAVSGMRDMQVVGAVFDN